MRLDEHLLEELYLWIDSLPLSRPKKRIERDFSDGNSIPISFRHGDSINFFFSSVSFEGKLIAEIVQYYLPDLVDLHNYSSANSLDHKKSNWDTLNKKVLSNFGLDIPDVIRNGLCNCKPGLVEVLLHNLRLKIDEELELKDKYEEEKGYLPKRQTSISFLTDKLPSKSRNSSLSQSKKHFNAKKEITLLDFEEVKQEYYQQEEEIEVLQAKLRRLEHVLHLKDKRIDELSTHLQDDRTHRSTREN